MKSLFFLYTLLCLTLTVSASVPRIKGKVVEAGNSTPIDYADIILIEKGKTNPVLHTLPETDGGFILSDIKDGEYSLLVRAVGFDVYTRSGIVLNTSATVFNLGIIEMKPLEQGLAEVEIVAQKRQVIYKLDKKVIDASNNLLASGGSAVDILENTPSIRVDAEGEVTFRGSSGFAVYVDGKPSVFSGSQALEQIPSGHIENIEIITTPSARHDTGGDVGIINIITKKHSQQGLNGMVNLTGSTMLSRGIDFLLTQQEKASRWYVGGGWNDRLRKSKFRQEKTTIVSDVTTISDSDGPRESNNFDYSLKAGWMYTLPKTTFNVDVQGGYGGRTRKGDLAYKEEQSKAGVSAGSGDYISHDDYDLHETYYQGTVGFAHKFNDKGHDLTGSYYLKYGGDAMEYFQSDLFNYQGERQQGHRAWEDEHRWTMRGNLDYIFPYRETGRIEGGYQYFSYLEDG
ncbi:MAG: TonB-dependent receptor, partial [Prevotella sp.]|nr:TonB-dependent receptor [Prevotella sp.]